MAAVEGVCTVTRIERQRVVEYAMQNYCFARGYRKSCVGQELGLENHSTVLRALRALRIDLPQPATALFVHDTSSMPVRVRPRT